MQQRTPSSVGAGVTGAYIIVTCLFFAWGFITSLNDPVVTAVKGIFCLTDVRAQLSAFAFFIAGGDTAVSERENCTIRQPPVQPRESHSRETSREDLLCQQRVAVEAQAPVARAAGRAEKNRRGANTAPALVAM